MFSGFLAIRTRTSKRPLDHAPFRVRDGTANVRWTLVALPTLDYLERPLDHAPFRVRDGTANVDGLVDIQLLALPVPLAIRDPECPLALLEA